MTPRTYIESMVNVRCVVEVHAPHRFLERDIGAAASNADDNSIASLTVLVLVECGCQWIGTTVVTLKSMIGGGTRKYSIECITVRVKLYAVVCTAVLLNCSSRRPARPVT